MTLTLLLRILAVVCFAVAWAVTVLDGSWTDPTPWGYAGLTAFAGSFLP